MKPNRNPSNSTDGSGKSNEKVLYDRPRGGTNTSLVDVSGRTSLLAGVSLVKEGAIACVSASACATAAPATPRTLIASRRESESVIVCAPRSGLSLFLPSSAATCPGP